MKDDAARTGDVTRCPTVGEHLRLPSALAVEDAATRLRRLERDLHDGAQTRLASLAATSAIEANKVTIDMTERTGLLALQSSLSPRGQ